MYNIVLENKFFTTLKVKRVKKFSKIRQLLFFFFCTCTVHG